MQMPPTLGPDTNTALVDSDTICPEGETMVPIDQYACNAITSAGRLNQISPPANGETHTTCPGAPSSGTSTTPSSSPAAPPLVQVSPAPSLEESVTTNNNTTVPSDTKMQNQVMFGSKHYSCVEIDGGNDESGSVAGSSILLNCTVST